MDFGLRKRNPDVPFLKGDYTEEFVAEPEERIHGVSFNHEVTRFYRCSNGEDHRSCKDALWPES